MKKKGFRKIESPEKMSIQTSGIEMTRRTSGVAKPERLTGGNGVADESGMLKQVLDFMRGSGAH